MAAAHVVPYPGEPVAERRFEVKPKGAEVVLAS